MTRDSRFDVLFEPVQTGPVTAKPVSIRCRNAALRAKRADADVIYVYAGHDSTLLMHFLSRRRNFRSDEYHRVAHQLDAQPAELNMPFRREQISLASSV